MLPDTLLYNVQVVDIDQRAIIPGSVVIAENGLITDISSTSRPPNESSMTLLDGKNLWLMPGMIDAHVHLRSGAVGDRAQDSHLTAADFMARALMNARITLEHGVTSVRDAGSSFGVGVATRNAIDRSWHPGPHVRAAGEPFSITGGHGDPQNGWPSHIQWLSGTIVDSPHDARRVARQQIRQRVNWLKFMASGGVSSVGDKSTEIGLREEDMRSAVEEARNAGIRTMAHAQAEEGIHNAIRAGVDSIEHGFYLSPWAIEQMAEQQIALVPTLSAMIQILAHKDQVLASTVEKAQVARDAHFDSVARARQGGVTIVMGTDAGTPFNFHGENAQEIGYLYDAGLSVWEALEATTIHAAQLLDIPTGRIRPQHWADLLLLHSNPIENLRVLTHPEEIAAILWQGTPVRWDL